MRRIISYQPTLGETALLILDEFITATLGTFYPHPYYHAFAAMPGGVRSLPRLNGWKENILWESKVKAGQKNGISRPRARS